MRVRRILEHHRSARKLSGVGREIAVSEILLVSAGELVLVDIDAEARTLDAAPVRSISDRNSLGQDVVFHELRSLLMADGRIGSGEHDMLSGRGGETEFAVSM